MEGQEFYQTTPFCSQMIGAEKRQYSDTKPAGDHFFVEEFLDFSNDEGSAAADAPAFFDAAAAPGIGSSDSSTVTAVDSSNSGCDTGFLPDIACRNFSEGQFSGELCVPYDDLAELEWLSNIVEESFSSEDLQRLQLISGIKARSADESSAAAVNQRGGEDHDHRHRPAKARSKRSRAPPCNWSSRLLLLSSSSSAASSPEASDENDSSSEAAAAAVSRPPPSTPAKKAPRKKEAADGEGRRCLHCATDKTPQWRTGPMGPKTLCNACGVRFKSGRLVPEYRPAASPTFVLTKHSNSHRKVLELRRQKDFARAQFVHHHPTAAVVFDHHGPPPSNAEDFLIHHHHTTTWAPISGRLSNDHLA